MTLERPLETVEMQINVGPQHPATHGVFRMVLQVDGERVVHCEPYIGYLHRGIEKLSESEPYTAAICHMDRADYLANFNMELPYVMAIEKLMDIEVPERAAYIRVILCELNRIASHLMFYGAFGADIGAVTPFLYAFRERERLQAIFEAVSGARMMHNYFRPGGVRADLPQDFIPRVRAVLRDVRQGIEECDALLSENEVFLARCRHVGVLTAEETIDIGCSGPVLRASGVRADVRRLEPYSVYDRFAFDIPIGTHGDCYDRYLIRLEEMRQSLRIVEQALATLPTGPIMGPTPRFIRPKPGEVYVRTESPRGDLGVYLVSRGGDQAHRVKVRAPSFGNLMALPLMLRDAYVADAVIILGSIDIVLGEVDR